MFENWILPFQAAPAICSCVPPSLNASASCAPPTSPIPSFSASAVPNSQCLCCPISL